jgi:hypothetical protein
MSGLPQKQICHYRKHIHPRFRHSFNVSPSRQLAKQQTRMNASEVPFAPVSSNKLDGRYL